MKLPVFLVAILCAVPAICFALEPISPAAERLGKFYDSLRVEELWIAGAIVDWRTGLPTGKEIKDDGKHTHCSQFAASACERLGVYLLRPPEHSVVLLANAQYDWLAEKGREQGWVPVATGVEAQDRANRGEVVVAVYKNRDPKKSGHIVLIRPGTRTEEEIVRQGPDIIQAGGTNYRLGNLKKGFGNHRKAFANGEIKFYAHPVVKFAHAE